MALRIWLATGLSCVVIVFGVIYCGESWAEEGGQRFSMEALEKLPLDAHEHARTLIQEVATALGEFSQDAPNRHAMAEIKMLIQALERDPSSESAELLIQRLQNQDGVYLRFLYALRERVTANPHALARVREALSSLQTSFELSKIPLPSLSRMALASAIIMSYDDFLYSYQSTFVDIADVATSLQYSVRAMASRAVMYAMVASLVLTDVIGIGIRARDTVERIKNSLRAKGVRRQLVSLVAGFQKNRDYITGIRGLKYMMQESQKSTAAWVAELIDKARHPVGDAQLGETQKWQFIDKFRDYMRTRRYWKVIGKAAKSLTPVELAQINQTLAMRETGPVFEIPQKIVDAQNALISDIEAWLAASPNHNAKDLYVESLKVENTIASSRLARTKPNFVAAANYFILSASISVAGYVSALGSGRNVIDYGYQEFLRQHNQGIITVAGSIGAAAFAVHLFLYKVLGLRERERRTGDRQADRSLLVKKSGWEIFRRSILIAQERQAAANKAPNSSQVAGRQHAQNASEFIAAGYGENHPVRQALGEFHLNAGMPCWELGTKRLSF